MNKNDLVAAVSARSGLTKSDSQRAVDAVFDEISDELSKGGDVRVVGFGSFSVATRKASEGRNPRTGERIHIPASQQPKFKAGKTLKEAVNYLFELMARSEAGRDGRLLCSGPFAIAGAIGHFGRRPAGG